MTKYLYKTELDGMSTISTERPVYENDYVYIQDKLYDDDITLFKNKKTADDKVDLKFVKMAEINLISEVERDNFKINKLYTFGNEIFTSPNRLNKNQLLEIHNEYYLVQEIIKHLDRPLELKLNKIQYVSATNMYTILQTNKKNLETEVYGRYPSYGVALDVLWRLREKRDNNYYRFL